MAAMNTTASTPLATSVTLEIGLQILTSSYSCIIIMDVRVVIIFCSFIDWFLFIIYRFISMKR